MLKILIILVFLVFYTYLLKRRFKVKMMEAWRAEKVGSEVNGLCDDCIACDSRMAHYGAL